MMINIDRGVYVLQSSACPAVALLLPFRQKCIRGLQRSFMPIDATISNTVMDSRGFGVLSSEPQFFFLDAIMWDRY
jgi:hypothetical protein